MAGFFSELMSGRNEEGTENSNVVKNNLDVNLYETSSYTTSIPTNNLIDAFESYFYVMCMPVRDASEIDQSKYVLNNAIHVCNEEAVAEILQKELKQKTGCDYTYYRFSMANLLEDVLENYAEAIVLYNVFEKISIISKPEVDANADIINMQNASRGYLHKAYSFEEAYSKVKDNLVYFAGDLSRFYKDGVVTDGAVFNFSKAKDGTAFMGCFANKYSASKFLKGGTNIDCMRLDDLVHIAHSLNASIIIEPNRSWWWKI